MQIWYKKIYRRIFCLILILLNFLLKNKIKSEIMKNNKIMFRSFKKKNYTLIFQSNYELNQMK